MSYYTIYHSPISDIIITSDGEYLTGLYFDGSINSSKHILNTLVLPSDIPALSETVMWLDTYFSGQIPSFTPKYKLDNLTPFRKNVVDVMTHIPYGKVITYGDIANMIAKKNGIKKMSAQAVGNAVGWNPICIIIPCHRVVGANHNLTGYGGGIQNKIGLLKIEKIDTSKYYLPKSNKGVKHD